MISTDPPARQPAARQPAARQPARANPPGLQIIHDFLGTLAIAAITAIAIALMSSAMPQPSSANPTVPQHSDIER